jgi:hypothetical protein
VFLTQPWHLCNALLSRCHKSLNVEGRQLGYPDPAVDSLRMTMWHQEMAPAPAKPFSPIYGPTSAGTLAVTFRYSLSLALGSLCPSSFVSVAMRVADKSIHVVNFLLWFARWTSRRGKCFRRERNQYINAISACVQGRLLSKVIFFDNFRIKSFNLGINYKWIKTIKTEYGDNLELAADEKTCFVLWTCRVAIATKGQL